MISTQESDPELIYCFRGFHEKVVKLFLKFISHFLGGGGIVLPSGLGMLVHVLIRCLPQRVERCYLNVEVSC
jgi:hypothetical protein